jgi:hypothetical protein
MPYDEPDPTDPSLLCGVSLPGGPETTREMAAVFAEEFARMGLPADEIRGLFRSPFYGAAHQALLLLGEETIDAMIAEAVAVWGRMRIVDRTPVTFQRPNEGRE